MTLFTEMIFSIIGGLGVFLLGMKNMSDGLQGVAGDGLRNFISKLTTNRFLSIFVGFIITAFIQSSSVTTVMAVGLVNSGLMTLTQSIGVTLGANIGTTVTGWILVLKIGKYGLPILGFSAFFYLFSKKDKVKFWGMALMGLGMVFFGLQLMKSGFKPLKEFPQFEQIILSFSAESFFGIVKCALIGCVLTMIVQSSSAMMGITMGLALAGSLNYTTASALILGQNIGTTITANLASIGTSTAARRAARAHLIFNILGVSVVIIIFPFFLSFVKNIINCNPDAITVVNGENSYPNILKSLAAVHTTFNLITAVIFIPFIPLLEKLVCKLVPSKEETPNETYLTYINNRMIEAPAIAIEQSRSEITHASNEILEMMNKFKILFTSDSIDNTIINYIFKIEEKMDIIQKEILSFLTKLMSQNISTNLVYIARRQIRLAEEYESISDYIVRILKIHLRLLKDEQDWSEDKRKSIITLHNKISEYLNVMHNSLQINDRETACEMHVESPQIVHMIKDFRNKHLERLSKGAISPLESTSYTDLLTCYRKINDHAFNIMEVICLEK